ncbi:hypothetical protein [Chitinophaga sp. CF418]|uniref:hypothetical protein n=1 Tax=Chitinophaga sp. CF418 TaxID=1855287 RepID=UPI000918EF00|nr:hypothetical protein [Chitinophaga sp. CF418]SHN07713.1 hypothetical protein SAMN05216311_10541 [Chitinophaga sp. CF418]
MQNLIIKDYISQKDLLLALSTFWEKENLSVGYLDTSIIQNEDVLLEASPLAGDVCINLCIYAELTFDIDELSVFICDSFYTSVLISDNDINPYSWILITKNGRQGIVYQVPLETGLFKLLLDDNSGHLTVKPFN